MKKFIVTMFFLLALSFGFCNSAFASTNDVAKSDPKNVEVTNILDKIDKTNVQIQNLIDEAVAKTSAITVKEAKDVSKLENKKAILQADSARLAAHPEDLTQINDKINICKERANYAIINIMKNLIKVTDKIADDMANEAAKNGIIVIQEYIPVTVNGVVYMVDPLKVDS